MNAGRRPLRRIVVLSAVLAGCASIPSITFVGGGLDGGTVPPGTDATITNPDDASGGEGDGMLANDARNEAAPPSSDGGGDDAPVDATADALEDVAVDQPSDDAGDAAATTKCGPSLVANCVSCPGLPLRCKRPGRDECVADCTSCGASFLPCLHCATPTAPPHGTCLPIQPNGQIACARANLCACSADTDCLAIPGASQTCELEAGKKVGCLICGAPTTAGLACVTAAGEAGTCEIADATAPTCQ